MRINAAQQHDNTKPRNKSKNARKKKNLPKYNILSQNRTADNSRIAPTFNEKTFKLVISDVAQSLKTVREICENHGVSIATLYRWIGNNEALQEQMARAREARARLRFDCGMDDMIGEMDDYAKREDVDFSVKKAVLQAYRIKSSVYQWLTERGNPREFGPKMEIDSRIAVDAGHEREQAWLARKRSIREADCEIVDTNEDTKAQEPNNINELGRDTRD